MSQSYSGANHPRASVRSVQDSTLDSPGRVIPLTLIVNRENPVPEEVRARGREAFNNYVEQRRREILEHNINVRANVEIQTDRLMYLHPGNIICPDCGQECHHNSLLQHRRSTCPNKRL